MEPLLPDALPELELLELELPALDVELVPELELLDELEVELDDEPDDELEDELDVEPVAELEPELELEAELEVADAPTVPPELPELVLPAEVGDFEQPSESAPSVAPAIRSAFATRSVMSMVRPSSHPRIAPTTKM